MEMIFEDVNGLMKRLRELEGVEEIQNRLIRKNLKEMSNRATKTPYTPVDTGFLKNHRGYSTKDDIFGYTADYAPHVEYGHRTKNGGYVKGQRYLEHNVNTQRTILASDLRNILRGL